MLDITKIAIGISVKMKNWPDVSSPAAKIYERLNKLIELEEIIFSIPHKSFGDE